MVEMMKLKNLRSESEPVKLEIAEDFVEEEHGPLNKRSKLWNNGTSFSLISPTNFNLLDEPSPLGLSLRKSPSFQDLIQTRLSQSGSVKSDVKTESLSNGVSVVGTVEKLKASNFPASVLRIGQWQYKSRYEGDLVAKCYFAKHKLVWEVLEQGLKSKIEIQWSDIMALKANCPEDEPGTLTITLARRPMFFRETNPQPRKHTLWQATSDFTDGQASMNRQHFIQCPQGVLNKHFEKLVQCDHRLFCLSQQSEIHLDSPYFDTRQSIFEDLSVSESPVRAHSSSEHVSLSHDALSPSSVMDARAIDGGVSASGSRTTTDWNQTKISGLHQSISMNNLLTFLSSENNQEFDEMKQLLLTDTQQPDASDEKSVMSKVNSFYNLLQFATNDDIGLNVDNRSVLDDLGSSSSSKVHQGLSRKDSFSDLLLQLPRIASLPKFLFNIAEDGEEDTKR